MTSLWNRYWTDRIQILNWRINMLHCKLKCNLYYNNNANGKCYQYLRSHLSSPVFICVRFNDVWFISDRNVSIYFIIVSSVIQWYVVCLYIIQSYAIHQIDNHNKISLHFLWLVLYERVIIHLILLFDKIAIV